MANVDGTPVLQPTEWFAEEIIAEFFDEGAEIVILEFADTVQTIEKARRLSKE